jgi:hypothetical protein
MKYTAFISYNSKDDRWAKWLQRKLESYHIPVIIRNEKAESIRQEQGRLKVFRYRSDLNTVSLNEGLAKELDDASWLIVICSPNSAKSEWVGKEIEFFHQLGRTKQIHFFIVDGVPHSGDPDTECFNPIVDTLGLPEILGASIHEKIYRWPWLNKERAYVQLVSKLLGVEFDAIWQRHKRQLIRNIIVWTIGALIVLATLLGVWIANQPVDVEVRLNEASVHNDNLPALENAVVTMTLDNETKVDTVRSLDSGIIFKNIPHRFINDKVRVRVECQNFLTTDTVVVLSDRVSIGVCRDPEVF